MNRASRVFCLLLAFAVVALSQTDSSNSSQAQFRTLTVDAGAVSGTIRSFRGSMGHLIL